MSELGDTKLSVRSGLYRGNLDLKVLLRWHSLAFIVGQSITIDLPLSQRAWPC
jgi:hypothetical protein